MDKEVCGVHQWPTQTIHSLGGSEGKSLMAEVFRIVDTDSDDTDVKRHWRRDQLEIRIFHCGIISSANKAYLKDRSINAGVS